MAACCPMMNPGERRETEWIKVPDGGLVKVAVRRGFDCRRRCEHVPPRPNEGGANHGQHCDEWIFEYRLGDHAALLQCYSWIRDGKIDPQWDARRRDERRQRQRQQIQFGVRPPASRLLETYEAAHDAYTCRVIYGARVMVHGKCAPDCGEECTLFGHCSIDFAGYLNSVAFFEQVHSDALEPLALKPVDEIDLAVVVDRMAPLWQKLRAFVVAKRDDGMIGGD